MKTKTLHYNGRLVLREQDGDETAIFSTEIMDGDENLEEFMESIAHSLKKQIETEKEHSCSLLSIFDAAAPGWRERL